MKEYCPIAVLVGVPVGSDIEFNHPLHKIVISNEVNTVWSILRLCDGVTKSEVIAKEVGKKLGLSKKHVVGVIEDMTSLEILIDSREAYKFFHKLGNNLSPFSTGLNPSEIYAIQNSKHLPSKTGVVSSLGSLSSTIGDLGMSRKSCRNFSKKPVSKNQLSELLRVAYSHDVKSSPSAGALYPIRIYALLLQNVDDLSTGMYEYNPESHTLTCFDNQIDTQQLEFAFNSESILHNAPVILVVSAELDRQPAKYANRGYRYSLIEAGHVAQTIHLVSEEMGLSTLEYCGFQDNVLSESLGSSESGIVPILTIAVGFQSEDDEDNEDELADQLVADLVGKGKPVNWLHQVNSPKNESELSFFYFTSHFRSTGHDDAKASYKDRLCGGTSTSYSIATVKAVAEGYERYRSGVLRVDHVASAQSITDKWLDPRIYAPYSTAQTNQLEGQTQFSVDREWEWVEGYDLATREKVLAPLDLVFYPLSSDKLGRELCHYANSNGVAAHTTYDAAIQGALIELIERDVVARNWFEKTPPAKVAFEALPVHWQRRARFWADRGYEIDILDMSQYGVCVANVVVHSEDVYPHFVTGTAASIDSFNSALTKAFQEAELSLVAMREEGSKPMSVEQLMQPTDHGLLYAQKEYLAKVDYLWSGCYNVPNEPSATPESLAEVFNPTVIDLSGSYQVLKVVRVLAEDLVPINFGYGVEHHTHKSLAESVRSRHFSELEPHYLA